jgi:thiol-disulfide isomerase/thioredoxin
MPSQSKVLLALLVPCILLLGCRKDTSTITGTLLGADGKPMPMAHVHVAGSTFEPGTLPRQPDPIFVTEQVQADGTFRITTRETGPLQLFFTGVGHEDQLIPLPLDRPMNLEVAVRLTRARIDTVAWEIQIKTSVDKGATMQHGSLIKHGDGTFRADIPTTIDSVEYAVYAYGPSRLVTTLVGATADRYQLATGNEYQASVAAHGGHAIIEYRIPPDETGWEGSVTFADTQSTVARFQKMREAFIRFYAAEPDAVRKHLESGLPLQSFTYPWLTHADSLARIAQGEPDQLLKEELLLEALECDHRATRRLTEHQVRTTIAAIEPTSIAWAYHESLPLLFRSVSDEGKAYVTTLIDRHPSRSYAAYLVFSECSEALREHDASATAALMARLRREFPNTSVTQEAEMHFAPPSRITIGAVLPRFAFRSAEDPARIFTNNTFQGNPLLVTYWATWCGPCVAELPQLHRVHEKYAQAGLQMLSVTLDDTPDKIANFRRYRWPMPWSVAVVQKSDFHGGDSTLSAGVGTHILVDRDGMILMHGGLEMARLDSVLGRLLPADHQ